MLTEFKLRMVSFGISRLKLLALNAGGGTKSPNSTAVLFSLLLRRFCRLGPSARRPRRNRARRTLRFTLLRQSAMAGS